MKKILILLAAVTLTACGTQKTATTASTTKTSMENKVDEVTKELPTMDATTSYLKDASGNLSGEVQKDAFMQAPFDKWFNSRLAAYQPDQESIDGLKVALVDIEIRAYMGTWCGDSKREVPQFYHILEAAYYDLDKVTMIAVDRSKSKPTDLVSGYDVKRVPTFIFYRDGKEIGRYVERPRESLEKDMLKIVTGQEYKHSYDN